MKKQMAPIYYTIIGLLMLAGGLITKHYNPTGPDFWNGFLEGGGIGFLVMGIIGKRLNGPKPGDANQTTETI